MNNQAANLIYELFDVSREEAEKYAEDFKALVEAKSGVFSPSVIENQVPKIYGKKLPWRSQELKAKYVAKQTSTQSSYNAYINKRRK